MAAIEQSIVAKLKVVIDGLDAVKTLSNELKNLEQKGGAALDKATSGSGKNTGQVKELSSAIRQLQAAVEEVKPGALEKLGNALHVVTGALGVVRGLKDLGVTMAQVRGFATSLAERFPRVTSAITGTIGGAKNLASSLSTSVTGGLQSAGTAATSLGSKLGGLAGGAQGGGAALAALGAGGAVAATGIGLLVIAVIAIAAALVVATAAAVAFATVGLKAIFEQGIEYNSMLESTKLGIASVIASLAELRSATGQKLDGADSLNASLALAGDQLKKLKVDAIQTTATFSQIAPAFQAAIGPGLAAGLTLDQIRGTVVKITQAAGAVGIPFEQLNQEVRAILEGTINEDARLAKVLGISNEMVKSWKAQGTLADELNKRLEKFALAGDKAAGTLDGLKSNLEEALQVFTGTATERAFETLKARIQKILPSIFDFKSGALDKSFQPLADIIDEIFVRGINIAGDFIEVVIDGVKSIARFIDENRVTIDAILDSAFGIISTLLRIAGVMVGATNDTHSWKNVLDLVLVLLKTIEIFLADIEFKIRQGAVAFQFLKAAAEAAIPGFSLLADLAGYIAKNSPSAQQNDNSIAFARGGPEEPPLPTAKGLPRAAAAGKKKGGGRANNAPIDALIKAQYDAELKLAQDHNDRMLEENERAFKGQIKAYLDYLEERADIQTTKIDNEIAQETRLRQLSEQQLGKTKDKREADRLQADIVNRNTQIEILQRRRADVEASVQRDYSQYIEEQRKGYNEITKALLELEGEERAAEQFDIDQKFEDQFKAITLEIDAATKSMEEFIASGATQQADSARRYVERLQQTKGEIEIVRRQMSAYADLEQVQREITDIDRQRGLELQRLADFVAITGLSEEQSAERRREIEKRYADVLQEQIKKLEQIIVLSDGKNKRAKELLESLRADTANAGAETAEDRIRRVQTAYDRLNQQRANAEARIGNLNISQFERDQKLLQVQQEYNGKLQEALDKWKAIAQAIADAGGDTKYLDAVTQAQVQLETANKHAAGFRTTLKNTAVDALSSGLNGFFTDLASGAKSLKGAALDFARSFIQALQQVIIQLVVVKLLQAALGGLFPGAGGAGAAVPGVGAAGKFAGGGLVEGPGTGTSDSILAFLSNREYVIPANRVAQYGLSFFESIRQGTLPRFADGGLVTDLQPAAGKAGSGSNLNQVFLFDPKMIGDYLMGPDGQRALLTTIGMMPTRVKTALG